MHSIRVNLVVDEPNQFVTIILPERDLLYLMVTQCMCIYRFHNKFDFQYVSLMDETPSYMGGKGNSWRKLTLDGKLKK